MLTEKTWKMFAMKRGDDLVHCGSKEWWVGLHGDSKILPVLVTEILDPDSKRPGPHYGWMSPKDKFPAMIQPHWVLFSMQFAGGGLKEEAAGQGRILSLEVQEI